MSWILVGAARVGDDVEVALVSVGDYEVVDNPSFLIREEGQGTLSSKRNSHECCEQIPTKETQPAHKWATWLRLMKAETSKHVLDTETLKDISKKLSITL